MTDALTLTDAEGTFATLREAFGVDDDSAWWLPFNAFLARAGEATVLVDTGVGPPGGDDPFLPERDGRLPALLAGVGVEPGDIELVVLTHLHPDHVGWNMLDGEPFFPRARYVAHRLDFENFTTRAAARPYVRDQLAALHATGRLELASPMSSRTTRTPPRPCACGSCRVSPTPAFRSPSRIWVSGACSATARASPGPRRTRPCHVLLAPPCDRRRDFRGRHAARPHHRLVARPQAATARGGHALPRAAPQCHRSDPRRRPLLLAARDPAGAGGRRRPARVVGRACRDHRLRVAAHARQLRRGTADRYQPAGASRRPRLVRRRGRRRRGDRPHVHTHPHARRRTARRPEREARLGYDSQLVDPQPGDVR